MVNRYSLGYFTKDTNDVLYDINEFLILFNEYKCFEFLL
jgi:hypothetical protein